MSDVSSSFESLPTQVKLQSGACAVFQNCRPHNTVNDNDDVPLSFVQRIVDSCALSPLSHDVRAVHTEGG